MASVAGRGAQVRLDGDEQAAARGSLGRRLHENIEFKQRIERAGIAADGNGPDGSPGSGAQALDEVLTPGGRVYGNSPAALPGAPPGTTPGTTIPPGGNPTDGTTPGTSPSTNPAPATAVQDRSGQAVMTRDGKYLEFRIPVVTDTVIPPGGTSPVVIPPPPGSVVTRDGTPLQDRSGAIVQIRTVPDATVPVVVEPDPEPALPTPVFPSTPHLRLASTHGNVIIESQDGANAVVRLVRPIYLQDAILEVTHAATPLGNKNTFYTYEGPDNLLTIQAGRPALTRDLLSTDDGTFTTQILQQMSDDSFLQVNVTFKVAPNRTGAVPAPSAVPSKASVVFFEDFLPGTGTGALNRSYGNIVNTGNSTVLLTGRASAMTQTDPANAISNDYGYPNGLYEFRVRFIGNLGNAGGPCILLWPASDMWPGPEVDMGEFFPDGTMYMANHWKDATKPTANNGQDQKTIWPIPQPFDPYAWNTLGARLMNTGVIFYKNGVEFARDTASPPPKDFTNGGENHTLGLLSGSDQSSDGSPTGLECDWIRFTPEALLP